MFVEALKIKNLENGEQQDDCRSDPDQNLAEGMNGLGDKEDG